MRVEGGVGCRVVVYKQQAGLQPNKKIGGGHAPYVRLTDSCITQLKAQGPSRTCNESKEEGLA